jgi:predicted RNase H-like nuclease (RuvC/YqgF family)
MGHTRGNDSGNHGWVTTSVAAAALGIKPRQCRNLIQEGELEARLEGEGRDKRYFVSVSSLEALRDKRQSEGKLPLNRRGATENEDVGDVGADLGQWVRELTARLETRAAENAELRTRLELTEKADSTLREQLDRERERADRLEEELREARRSWLSRMFGG